jgi:NAD(P)-dependent dehydrogenase (short-subunit alcohol dehydrogenase family)
MKPPNARSQALLSRPTKKVALVTGASRGIGRAIAEKLARGGIYVFVNFRVHAKEAAKCVDAIRRAGGFAEAIRADVSQPSDIRRMMKAVERRAGRLDIVVCNAGVAPIEPNLDRLTSTIWKKTFDVNVLGSFLCAKESLPLLKRSPAPRIIFVGSAASRLGGSIGAHYAASKAALSGLMEYLSRALGKHRITVNLIEPGFIRTDMTSRLFRPAGADRAMRRQVPLGVIGTAADLAAGVEFLAGDEASYVTRQTLAISGGR